MWTLSIFLQAFGIVLKTLVPHPRGRLGPNGPNLDPHLLTAPRTTSHQPFSKKEADKLKC
jgi:hypothetical protein